jgi:hypothetical protein
MAAPKNARMQQNAPILCVLASARIFKDASSHSRITILRKHARTLKHTNTQTNNRPAERASVERSVDVSSCELRNGMWYISVEPGYGGGAYVLTALVEGARLILGQSEEDTVCCMQSKFYFLDILDTVKGNELVIKLISDTRLRRQVGRCLSFVRFFFVFVVCAFLLFSFFFFFTRFMLL